MLPLETFVRYQAALGMAPAQVEDHELGRLPQFFADTQGWPELAAAVADVHEGLHDEERKRARVSCSNYGQAGAIDLFGPRLGLPPAISGHNAYHTWGPGDFDGSVLIVVGVRREQLLEFFEETTLALEFEHPDAMPYEARKPIWLARRLRGSVEDFWSAVKSFH